MSRPQADEADRFAANVLPIIKAIRASGVSTFRWHRSCPQCSWHLLGTRWQMACIERAEPGGEIDCLSHMGVVSTPALRPASAIKLFLRRRFAKRGWRVSV
jgi:hypothetical protein